MLGIGTKLTNFLHRERLNTGKLGGMLVLVGSLLLTKEGEGKNLADRVVISQEHGKTIDTETPTTGRRHCKHDMLASVFPQAYKSPRKGYTYGRTRGH